MRDRMVDYKVDVPVLAANSKLLFALECCIFERVTLNSNYKLRRNIVRKFCWLHRRELVFCREAALENKIRACTYELLVAVKLRRTFKQRAAKALMT